MRSVGRQRRGWKARLEVMRAGPRTRTTNYEAEQEYGRVLGLCERFRQGSGEIYQLSSISTNRIQLALCTVVEEGQTREEGRGPRD